MTAPVVVIERRQHLHRATVDGVLYTVREGTGMDGQPLLSVWCGDWLHSFRGVGYAYPHKTPLPDTGGRTSQRRRRWEVLRAIARAWWPPPPPEPPVMVRTFVALGTDAARRCFSPGLMRGV